ncbi:nucleolin-like isoform X2 [Notothenia coriiceps]|uniref:Nucleolin-like isoform X2 n=1 Tax=Notothenia coriiceps TaxID=8208 RepID=A0A6I9P4Z3_9TELE|nr:PREDICTED: nucleolin-like isoform X2 [Notothenia coriiceps]
MATRRSTRKSQAGTSEVVEEEDNVTTVVAEGQTEIVSSSKQIVATEDAPKENQDEQDPQIDAVIEVKGSTSTVDISWDEKSNRVVADAEKRTSDQIMDSETKSEIAPSAEAVVSTEDTPSESTDVKQESEECQMDIVAGSTAAVSVVWEKKSEEGESDGAKKETNGAEQTVAKAPVKGKRKASSTVDVSPPKKTKLINDGFCLFVGNLNKSKTFEEIKDSLANYFMTQSVLVQDIRLDRSRKHAFVDLASEMDLLKGLMLNGHMMNELPMKVAKAKVKSEDKVKPKLSFEEKRAKNSRCLFLKNIPYEATTKDILKVFKLGTCVRFPGGAETPKTGIAYVEFPNKAIARTVLQQKQGAKMSGRVLIVEKAGEKNGKVTKTDENKDDTKAAADPNKTLFVSNLPFNVPEINLKKIFAKAVSINLPKSQGKPKRFAFVEFASAAHAEKALQSSQKLTISKREIKVQFCDKKEGSAQAKHSLKTLIVMGLAEKTTAETLKSAFEGASSARVTVDKETGVSKKFGFVEFESEDNCKAGKESMEDCEIDGSKVTVTYAKVQAAKGPKLPSKPPQAPVEKSAGQAGKRGKGKKKGKKSGAVAPQDAVKEVENKG